MNDQDDLILPATVDELIKLLNKVYPEKSASVTEQPNQPILSEAAADTENESKIIEVELPNGGLRITTRQE